MMHSRLRQSEMFLRAEARSISLPFFVFAMICIILHDNGRSDGASLGIARPSNKRGWLAKRVR